MKATMQLDVKRSTTHTGTSTPRKRRVRSAHAGVVLIRPAPDNRERYWRARFEDPDTGKLTKVRLDPLALPTAELRAEWAKRKARELAKRRMQLESGAPRATGTALDEAIKRYYSAHPQLRPKTVRGYKAATARLLAWAASAGVQTVDDLNRARLMGFRESLIAEPKRAPVKGKGAKRGKRQVSAAKRSAVTVNGELRRTQTVLGYLRELDMFAHLSGDDLGRVFKPLPVTHERREYLRAHELRTLLEAALRHDAETFDETRAEHAGQGTLGTTPCYEPIAPFVAFVMLTGVRLGEALALDWASVDLHALDSAGDQVGEINLRGAGNKTGRARTIALEVSPGLRRLLAALQLRTGGEGPVFQLRRLDEDGKAIAFTVGLVDAAALRLRHEGLKDAASKKRTAAGFGAPKAFGWQALRRTCGTFLTNAPGIFGAASAYRSAKQLGHSVAVAEKHYVGLVRGIPLEAKTLEDAMQIADVLEKVIEAVGGTGKPARLAAISGGKVAR